MLNRALALATGKVWVDKMRKSVFRLIFLLSLLKRGEESSHTRYTHISFSVAKAKALLGMMKQKESVPAFTAVFYCPKVISFELAYSKEIIIDP